MMEADKKGTAGYKLQLDGYEDFSILDDKDQIVSLHQCKSIKGRKDYVEDLKKMKLFDGKLGRCQKIPQGFIPE